MELPKNIVQIGKPDRVHKIYIEDYVVSYIKQLNRACDDRAIGLALYGKLCEEAECRYYFLYGAARIEGLEHRGPYLSQAEKEEIAETGKKYFEEYEFLAWCSIKGEPLESLFVKVQGKGVEVEGYACFYEKNESMLNYMLLSGQKPTETLGSIPGTAARQEEKNIQTADSKTFRNTENKENGTVSGNARPARGEWRAADYMRSPVQAVQKKATVKDAKKTVSLEKGKKEKPLQNLSAKRTEYMKLAAVAAFMVLCVIGVTTLNDYGKLEDLQVAASQVIANMTEQKLPDSGNNTISGGSAGEKENSVSQPETAAQTGSTGLLGDLQFEVSGAEGLWPGGLSGVSGNGMQSADNPSSDGQSGNGAQSADNPSADGQSEGAQGADNQAGQAEPSDSQSVVVQQPQEQEPTQPKEELPTSYTIVRGDTLISICTNRYGSLEKLKEICELNGISNADNIQVGQTILLP